MDTTRWEGEGLVAILSELRPPSNEEARALRGRPGKEMIDTPLGPRSASLGPHLTFEIEEARKRGWLFLVSPEAKKIIARDPRKTIGGRPGSGGYVNVYRDATSAACADWLEKSRYSGADRPLDSARRGVHSLRMTNACH